MKKLLLLFGILAFTFASCGDKKKEEVKKEVEPAKVEETVKETTEAVTETAGTTDQLAMGEKLFTEKTCATCHALDSKIIGPSIKDIIKIYDENDGNIVKFLRGNQEPIVDKDPGQVAVMKANIDGFVKDMTAEELQAVAAYMRNAAK